MIFRVEFASLITAEGEFFMVRSMMLLGLGIAAISIGRSNGAVERLERGVIVRVPGCSVRVLACDSGTVRVTAVPGNEFPTRKSLVVLGRWPDSPWTIEESPEEVIVKVPRVVATVDRSTGTVTFRDARGKILLREKPRNPGAFEPTRLGGEAAWHVRQRFLLGKGEGIYGLGQFEDGTMNYRGHDIVLVQNNRHIVVPFLVSSKSYGIYWDNYSDTRFHDGPDGMSLWSEVADGIDYYFIAGRNIGDAIAGYREATGRVPMFPRWAFGYWQSRERYENQDQLMSVAREYRRRHIPIDNIVQDWQYWGRLGWNAMAFDDSLYPDPRGMIDSLHRLLNMHIMVSIWPQVDSGTAVYRDLWKTGHLFPTKVWNGGKTYDAYSEEARSIYWDHLNRGLFSLGVDAWWADATEPDSAWCDTPLDEKLGIVSNGQTAIGSSWRYLNTYALVTTTGLYENQRATAPDKRVMILTRSAFAGQQRNSMAVWSGDIPSTWETFRHQIAAGINFSMAGIPWWNSDIGGFLPKEYGGEFPRGTKDPAYDELYVRWFQFGALCPIFRSHGTDFPKEVWEFGHPGSWAYDALLRALRLRYRLMPYIYSTAWEVTHRNATMMRGLPIDFASDSTVLSIPDEYLFGPSMLVSPVTRSMYYPQDKGVLIPASMFRTGSEQQGLTGRYYAGKNFDSLVATRVDSVIGFDWNHGGAPGLGRRNANFSVRWQGELYAPEDGKYEIEITSDDGVNLFVDGTQLMDEMYPAGKQLNYAEVTFRRGTWHAVTVEYQQLDKQAEIVVRWRTPSHRAAYHTDTTVKSVPVYLPSGRRWFDFWSGESHRGGRRIAREVPMDILPLYVPAGAIIPLGPSVEYAGQKPDDTIEVRVYPGSDGRFLLYEDEGDGYGYEKGSRAEIALQWNDAAHMLTIGERKGEFPGMLRKRVFLVVLVGPMHGVGDERTDRPDALIVYTGSANSVKLH